ncbi:ATP-binding protein [Streptomyces sp. NPDC002785]|uniref:ATP-binding protein n=1 Tax=Streptomyces sp. NPDC002785 TaxID=3154543 RepID=UPI00332F9891
MTPPPGVNRRVGPQGHIRWQGRTYTGALTQAHAGTRVTVRPSPQHGQIELTDPATGQDLGTAHALRPTPPVPDTTPQPEPTTAPELPLHPTTQGAEPMTTTTDTTAETSDDPDFYLDLPDARIVATEALLEAGENIADTIDARAMSCIYGDAGLGKTFSVLAALKEVAPDLVLLLQFRSRPTPRDIRMELFEALHLEGKPPAHPSEFDRLLKLSLARRPYVLVCDEAQQFSRECFEFVRHLWDTGRKKNRPAVLFVGGEECYKTLYNEPALASRIYIWQEFTPMEPDEVLKNIPLFHPVWASAPADLINFVDLEAGGGTFRMWSKITHHVLEGMKHRELSEVNETIARWAVRRARPARPVRRDDDR